MSSGGYSSVPLAPNPYAGANQNLAAALSQMPGAASYQPAASPAAAYPGNSPAPASAAPSSGISPAMTGQQFLNGQQSIGSLANLGMFGRASNMQGVSPFLAMLAQRQSPAIPQAASFQPTIPAPQAIPQAAPIAPAPSAAPSAPAQPAPPQVTAAQSVIQQPFVTQVANDPAALKNLLFQAQQAGMGAGSDG